jgi:hypothetical protein
MRSANDYMERLRNKVVATATFSQTPPESVYAQILQGRQPFMIPTPTGTTVDPSCCYSSPICIITCSNTTGTNYLQDPQPTGPFYVTAANPGVGIVNFQFLQDSTIIGSQSLVLTGHPQLVTPTEGFTHVQYVFQCTPAVVNIVYVPSDFLEPTLAYGFENSSTTEITITLTRTDTSILSFNIPGGTYPNWHVVSPLPAYGYVSYTTS